MERRGQGTDRGGILCARRDRVGGGAQHDISPQHLFAWRKAARAGALSLPADTAPLFVPVVTHHDGVMPAAVADGSGGITIEIAGVVVRAAPGADPAWLRDVLRAVKAVA